MKGIAIACLMLLSMGSHAADPETEAPQPAISELITDPDTASTTVLQLPAQQDGAMTMNERAVYVPPRRGAPATRVGGGTRSGESAIPKISPLSPEHTGLTIQSAPTLYWWLSEDHNGIFEFVITSLNSVEPELRFRTEGTQPAGVHGLELAAHDVELESGQVYMWSVAIVRDEQRRSHDIVGIATVERTTTDTTVPASPAALASAGLWYDAIQLLSEPPNPSDVDEYRAIRADLLQQVGLAPIAAAERQSASAE